MASQKVLVSIYIPEGAKTNIDIGLCELTKILCEKGLADEPGYGLGGHWGYGTDFENDTFMIHQQCWCDQDDCPWCGGCACPDDAFHYYVDGKEVSFEEWVSFHQRMTKGLKYGSLEYEKASLEANKRRKAEHIPECDYCLGKGVFAAHGAEPGKGAPNFWYKPTNFKIWWYKWIGRDMEFNREITLEEWENILNECVKSILEG